MITTAQSVWTLRNPLPTFKNLRAVATNGTQVVAVGDSGTVLTSVDGTSWTKRVPVVGTTLWGVTSAGSQWVAVGAGGVILTSPDAVTWTARTSTVTTTLFGVHWTGSLFVAVGQGGVILTSGDGVAWSPRSSNTTTALNAVSGTTGLVVVVGDGGTITSSPDGITWTTKTSGTTAALYGVGWGNGLFLAVGNNGVIRTSTDGSNWVASTSGVSTYLISVRYANGQFVIVGNGGTILTSTTGTSWTPQSSATTQALYGVTWSGTQWVAVSVGGFIRVSSTGTGWTDPSATIAGLNAAATVAAKPIVVVGDGGTIVTSADSGKSWSNRTSAAITTEALYGAAWNSDLCVVVGDDGTLLSSATGVTWTIRNSGVGTLLTAVTWTGSLFIAVGAGGVIRTSPDGISWTPRTSNASGNLLNAVTWTGTQAIAVGAAGTVVTSSDGTTWTARTSGTTTTTFYGVTGNSTQVVITGQGGAVRTSPDGITWTPRTSGVTTPLYAVGWSGSLYAATSSAGTVLTSTDAVTWTAQSTGTTSALFGMAWPFGSMIAVGAGGSIVTSPQAAVPAAPALLSPNNGATGVSVFTTLSWGAVSGASSYRVQVSTDTLFGSVIANDSVTTTSRSLPALSATTKYFWRVNARNSVGVGPFSLVRSFTTGLPPTDPPPVPVLVSPEPFATGVSIPATLTWNSALSAETYHAQVSTSPGFVSSLLNDSALTTTSRVVTGLSEGIDYYWRVRARNGVGYSAWAETRTFRTTIVLPTAPQLLTPTQFQLDVNRATNLTWSAVTGAQAYRVQVSTNTSFSSLVAEGTDVTSTSFTPTSVLAANTDHYWRVNAKNAAGAGEWSSTFRFTTGIAVSVLPGQSGTQFSRLKGKGYFRFALPHQGRVVVRLRDVKGAFVAQILDETRAAGDYTVALPGGLSQSLYLLEFQSPGRREWITVHP